MIKLTEQDIKWYNEGQKIDEIQDAKPFAGKVWMKSKMVSVCLYSLIIDGYNGLLFPLNQLDMDLCIHSN